ncbi:MAG: OsmC family peroxiredoxin [Acidobacteria bacterium]|nr:OsmC family peroxiredoxin [Acidobacteriota bacterium]|tara:strand:+ start:3514 stop:3939 length:426 start_codon:yes stop_codon:yes gene_type:complete
MDSKASAIWRGDLKGGSGAISSTSGVLTDAAYTFATRFEGSAGTNPEELIAAAHAGCFSMALSHGLAQAGLTPAHVSTSATVSLEQVEDGFAVTRIHLEVSAKVPGADQAAFESAANDAKAGCPISKLMNAEISMTATLES